MLSIPHLIVIFIVALVVFGPEKLPELARNLGKVMAEFRRHTGDLRSTFEGHLRDIEREADNRRTGGTPAPAPPEPEQQAYTPSPGTVPSDPPNAAAIANKAAEHSPEGLVDSDPKFSASDDPHRMNSGIPPGEASSAPEQSKSEENSEQVSDGRIYPS